MSTPDSVVWLWFLFSIGIFALSHESYAENSLIMFPSKVQSMISCQAADVTDGVQFLIKSFFNRFVLMVRKTVSISIKMRAESATFCGHLDTPDFSLFSNGWVHLCFNHHLYCSLLARWWASLREGLYASAVLDKSTYLHHLVHYQTFALRHVKLLIFFCSRMFSLGSQLMILPLSSPTSLYPTRQWSYANPPRCCSLPIVPNISHWWNCSYDVDLRTLYPRCLCEMGRSVASWIYTLLMIGLNASSW